MQTDTQTQTEVNAAQTVAALRLKASQSPVFSAVAHKFALRERSRAQITLSTLMAVMDKEGFKFSRDDYAGVLKFMASIGIGRLEFSRNNRLQALKDIKVTLQSIGQAAISKKEELDKAATHNTFKKLPVDAPKIVHVQSNKTVRAIDLRHPAELIVKFSKDEVTTFKLPGISSRELGSLLSQLYTKG